MTNLEKLTAAEDSLSNEESIRFDAYMLGALSVLVSPEVWQQAIDATHEYIKTRRGE